MTKVQGDLVTYELHTLGWKAFQDLCATITSEIWGQVVEGFFDSADGGRDGAFHGTWTPQAGEAYTGSFSAQCKFSAKASKTIRQSELTEEISKARRLAARGLADNYFLFTSAQLTGSNAEELREVFETIPGIKRFAAFGRERISQIIRESPRLRMLVPRVYGIGDLSQILDERAYAQAQEILSALGDDLAKFVITDAYRRSAKALVEHGFVLLLGEPACGKSTIAATLAVGATDEWGCSTTKLRDADDLVAHSNPHDPKQFFWVDDAFGATQLDLQSTVAWNRAFPHLLAAIRRGARVVFTSRDYIYRAATNFLKESAFPLLKDSQVVIRVEQIDKGEREQILYNHIRLGTQAKAFKRVIKPFLPIVAGHSAFSPEIARRLGNPSFTRHLSISKHELDQFVAKPMELLREILRTLDANSRSAIALVFMRGGLLRSPVELSDEEKEAITVMGGSIPSIRGALIALENSFLLKLQSEGDFFWRFKHPTIRDAFGALLSEDRELMDIYLAGAPVERMLQEVACGATDMEGVKVIVPGDRYEPFMERVESFRVSKRENRDATNLFLARRCDKPFVAKFIERDTTFLSELRTSSYLYAVSDVDLIVRVNEFDLLPENERLRHVANIYDLAINTPDSGFLRDDIRTLLKAEELNGILRGVRSKLLPNLRRHVDEWQDNHNGEEDPDSYFSELKSALDDYRAAFEGDAEATEMIDRGLLYLAKAIDELYSQMPAEPDYDDYHDRSSDQASSTESRSIFDDVDQ